MSNQPTNNNDEKMEAVAKARMLKTSPQKLNLVSKLIRNKPVNVALAQLKFSKKRIAVDVRKCLESAIANALVRFWVISCWKIVTGQPLAGVGPAPFGIVKIKGMVSTDSATGPEPIKA